jgi:hypothetical protein
MSAWTLFIHIILKGDSKMIEGRKILTLWIVITVLLLCITFSCCSKRSQTIQKSEGELNAKVKWDGQSFSVTNKSPFDWRYVMLQVNDGGNAYLYLTNGVKKERTIKVAARKFFHGTDRRKLDVSEFMLLTFTICEGDPYNSSYRFWRGVIYNHR